MVVEDVITTGGSTLETMEVVKAHGGRVLGALSVIDRSGGKAVLDNRYHSLWTLNIPTFNGESCPLCKAGSAPIKPGSRATVKG